MKNLFVPYIIAKQLKELGYNEPSLMVYYGMGTSHPEDKMYIPSAFGKIKNTDLINFPEQHIYNEGQITAPLYQQVVDWFREEHGVVIHVFKSENGWRYTLGVGLFEKYNNYYDALNAGIEEAVRHLQIIKRHR